MRKLVLKSGILLGVVVIVGLIFPTLSRNYDVQREENQIFHRSNENTRITKDNVLGIVSKLDLITRESNMRQDLCLDDLLFELMVESVSEINNDMFIHMTDDLLVDFMNFQFEVFNDLDEYILDVVRNDFSNDKEALRFFEYYITQEITELNESNDHMARSNSLRIALSTAGLSSASVNVIVGAFNVVAATMRLRFTPNVVRGLLIGSALLVTTTTIILNWRHVAPILDAITNEFVNVARNFANTINNFFNNVRNQARAVFAITIGIVTFFAETEVTHANINRFQTPGQFFLAILHNNRLHVYTGNVGQFIATQALRIPMGKAAGRIDFGVYTFKRDDALMIAIDAGNDRIPFHQTPHTGPNIAFAHFHVYTTNAHSWYGLPS